MTAENGSDPHLCLTRVRVLLYECEAPVSMMVRTRNVHVRDALPLPPLKEGIEGDFPEQRIPDDIGHSSIP